MRPDTTSRILAALPAAPGITVAELTERLDLADSTIRKTLTALTAQGQACRIPGTGAGRRRTPDRWAAAAPTGSEAQPTVEPAAEPDIDVEMETTAELSPAPPEGSEAVMQPTTLDTAEVADQPPSTPATVVPAPPETPGAQETTPAAAADVKEPGPGSPLRLAPGQLRDLVHQFLLDHAAQEPGGFGPAAIGKHLGRSQGAVANSLDKLVNQGLVVQVKDKPRRLAAVQDPPATPGPARQSAANGKATPSPATANGRAAPAPMQPAMQPATPHAAANGTNTTTAD